MRSKIKWVGFEDIVKVYEKPGHYFIYSSELHTYEKFYGIGHKISVWNKHECDCELCYKNDGYDVEKNFETKELMEKYVKNMPEDMWSYIGEQPFVKLVKQELNKKEFELKWL